LKGRSSMVVHEAFLLAALAGGWEVLKMTIRVSAEANLRR
jgi:hypothetical protein